MGKKICPGILWAMNSAASISIEARSLAALKIKVAAHKAFGWSEDGDRLEVTDYTKRRPIKRYAQIMYRSPALSFHQLAVQ